jgi:hypothetical protein
MPMDVLSEVLRTVRLTGATFFSAEFRVPWGFTSPPMETLAPKLESASRHVVLYHLITEGHATARLDGQPDVMLEAGDVVVFPHGHSHRVWQGRPRAWYDTGPAVRRALQGDLQVSRAGGTGALTPVRVWLLQLRAASGTLVPGRPASVAESEPARRQRRCVA